MINRDTVWAACCCLSIHSLHQTKKEAEMEALRYEQQIGNSIQKGYVIELSPGQLNDHLYQGGNKDNDYIQYDGFNQWVRPSWLVMKYEKGEKVIDTPSRLRGYAHREW